MATGGRRRGCGSRPTRRRCRSSSSRRQEPLPGRARTVHATGEVSIAEVRVSSDHTHQELARHARSADRHPSRAVRRSRLSSSDPRLAGDRVRARAESLGRGNGQSRGTGGPRSRDIPHTRRPASCFLLAVEGAASAYLEGLQGASGVPSQCQRPPRRARTGVIEEAPPRRRAGGAARSADLVGRAQPGGFEQHALRVAKASGGGILPSEGVGEPDDHVEERADADCVDERFAESRRPPARSRRHRGRASAARASSSRNRALRAAARSAPRTSRWRQRSRSPHRARTTRPRRGRSFRSGSC